MTLVLENHQIHNQTLDDQHNPEGIFETLDAFLNEFFKRIKNLKINVQDYELDHVCYRVSSVKEYHAVKQDLSSIAKVLIEQPIGGRLISTWKLFNPFKYLDRNISVIELPMPKENSFYPTGWEHGEFVITDFDLFLKDHGYLTFDYQGFTKDINRDLRVDLLEQGDGRATKQSILSRMSVKFHLQPLEDVINLELEQMKVI